MEEEEVITSSSSSASSTAENSNKSCVTDAECGKKPTKTHEYLIEGFCNVDTSDVENFLKSLKQNIAFLSG